MAHVEVPEVLEVLEKDPGLIEEIVLGLQGHRGGSTSPSGGSRGNFRRFQESLRRFLEVMKDIVHGG